MQRIQISREDVADPDRLRVALDRAYANTFDLLVQFNDLKAQLSTVKGQALSAEDRLLLTQLAIGSTSSSAPPQNALIPSVDTLPPAASSIDGQVVLLSTDGQQYRFKGSTQTWVVNAAGTHNLLSATHPDTTAAAPVLGDLIAANGTPDWVRVAGSIVAAKRWLRQTGSGAASALPTWDQPASTDLSDAASIVIAAGTFSVTGRQTALGATNVATGLTGLCLLVLELEVTAAATSGKIELNVITTDRVGTFTHSNISDITGASAGADVSITSRYRIAFPVYMSGASNVQISTTFNTVVGVPTYAIDAAVIKLS